MNTYTCELVGFLIFSKRKFDAECYAGYDAPSKSSTWVGVKRRQKNKRFDSVRNVQGVLTYSHTYVTTHAVARAPTRIEKYEMNNGYM